jgi:hypothetical protein
MKSALILFALIQLGCYDPNAHRSQIVREVEGAGAGDLRTYTAPGLRAWFAKRPDFAIHISTECRPLAKVAGANWITTAEGSSCQAAANAAAWAHRPWTSDEKGY